MSKIDPPKTSVRINKRQLYSHTVEGSKEGRKSALTSYKRPDPFLYILQASLRFSATTESPHSNKNLPPEPKLAPGWWFSLLQVQAFS
jgi:hypothetical protein